MKARYVPVVRWKKGEQLALEALYHADRFGLVPLVCLPQADAMTAANRRLSSRAFLLKTAIEVEKCWGAFPMFFDLRPLEDDSRSSTEAFYSEARIRGANLVPVTRLCRQDQYQAGIGEVLAQDARGLCLRLGRAELESEQLAEEVDALLSLVAVRPAHVDLVVDLGIFENTTDYHLASGRLPGPVALDAAFLEK